MSEKLTWHRHLMLQYFPVFGTATTWQPRINTQIFSVTSNYHIPANSCNLLKSRLWFIIFWVLLLEACINTEHEVACLKILHFHYRPESWFTICFLKWCLSILIYLWSHTCSGSAEALRAGKLLFLWFPLHPYSIPPGTRDQGKSRQTANPYHHFCFFFLVSSVLWLSIWFPWKHDMCIQLSSF